MVFGFGNLTARKSSNKIKLRILFALNLIDQFQNFGKLRFP